MRFLKLILGELVLLFASIFVFRSVWTMLDEYFGYSHLEVMLIIGVLLTIAGFYFVNYGVKCELERKA